MYTLRVSTEADADFAYETIKTTMRDFALQTWGVWLDDEARQDAVQGARTGKLQVICSAGERVGLLQYEKSETEIAVKQLFLLPTFQYRGIGGEVVADLKKMSEQTMLPLVLSVLQVNPAKEFYLKKGFAIARETDERVFMQYFPPCRSRNDAGSGE